MPTCVTSDSTRAGPGSALLGLGLGFRLGHALQILAGALGHVLVLARVVVGLGLAGTRVGVGQVGAVVLARLGDAVALLLVLALRSRVTGDAERQRGGQGRGDEQTLIHG